MELISAESGQSLQLIHMDEVRPLRGGVFAPDLRNAIMGRYRFQSVAAQTEPNAPLKLETGAKEINGSNIPIASLEIYTDGIIVNTHHTDDSDAVMDDFIGWISQTVQLRQPRTWLPRRYFSRIVVDLACPAGETFITNFVKLNEIVATALGAPQVFEPQITFAPHPPGELQASRTWTFQPRIGQPYAPNRYFSVAPLATMPHYEMLCAMETATSSR
jgi:hypothetical protein